MTRGKWHILRDGACWGLARQRTARFDFWSETVLPLCHPVRLMHQIRQDLWRALQRLRGFSPVIWLTPTAQGWDVRAGGAAATPIAPVWSERSLKVLEHPQNRDRWVRHAGVWETVS